ncbi:molybdopterin cofactor-binding domain-containing protein [Streptomyces sp. T028]|uniref:xanthine dehydrogenase family protein molybdopterin-binding subunit n=1 Tax=Streptomyces sp. T028 TaxID=3394379 RepID=UPI003A896593
MTASEDLARLSPSLMANPRPGDWLRFVPGAVEVRSGKAELGQGVLTALAQIAADELDVSVGRIRMIPVDTDLSPDEGYTQASLSVQHSGSAIRIVCAEVRARCLSAAAERWGVPADTLTVRDGRITGTDDGQASSYWDLVDDSLLDEAVTGRHPVKPSSAYTVVGTDVPRLDLPAKFTGRHRYAHDIERPGLLYGRVVRPPSRGAKLVGVDTNGALALPGVVTVVRDGEFLGVVAEREEVALMASERLGADAKWEERATLPDEDQLVAHLTSAPADTEVLTEHGSPPADFPGARSVRATYHRPYIAHASIGPSSATAEATVIEGGTRLEVWSHSQGVHVLRRKLAEALGLAVEHVGVRHVEGAGCYGHNGADDVAMDASVLALAVPGRPVQVVWSRADELGWAPYGPAAVARVTADLDPDGGILSWRHEIWGYGHLGRPGSTPTPGFLAASHREGGRPVRTAPEIPIHIGGAAGRNAIPGYAFPSHQVINHDLRDAPLRTSALRALGAHLNVFAAESFLDDLAVEAGRDPVEYRLAHLDDPRARAVVEAAARRAGWSGWSAGDSVGHGIGYARYKNSGAYCAVVAEVEAVEEVRVRRLVIAVDAGTIVSPDGTENQVEGGAIQATSWTLKERVRFDRFSVTSVDWESYPILRFSEVPAVDVELLPGNGHPPLGVGEAAQGPTTAAIANALYDALGVRVRCLPLTAEQIVAAMPD